MKLLLIYPPFCTPTAMPYSLAALKSNLIASLQLNIKCLDLNAYFHTIQFPTYYQNLQLAYQQGLTTYGKLLQDFENESREVYAQNHKLIFKPSFNKLKTKNRILSRLVSFTTANAFILKHLLMNLGGLTFQ